MIKSGYVALASVRNCAGPRNYFLSSRINDLIMGMR
jgi:hypothetical protein